MTVTTTQARSLDRGAAPERFARGWHCLGPVGQFGDGEPHAVEASGGKLVVWAASDGRLNVLDGFCRHMGGDLAPGTVKGGESACPFQDWRWGGTASAGRSHTRGRSRCVPGRRSTRPWEVGKKNSEHHTSIQWDRESLAASVELQRVAAQPAGRHVHASCPRLRSSIDRAVAKGQIGAEDGC